MTRRICILGHHSTFIIIIKLCTSEAVAKCIVIGPVCGFVCGCVCLFVGCYHDNSKLSASIFTKLGL